MGVQDKYTYRVQWDEEDGKFVATVAEMPSLSWLADTQAKAVEGLRAVVDETIEDMQEQDEEVPLSEHGNHIQ